MDILAIPPGVTRMRIIDGAYYPVVEDRVLTAEQVAAAFPPDQPDYRASKGWYWLAAFICAVGVWYAIINTLLYFASL